MNIREKSVFLKILPGLVALLIVSCLAGCGSEIDGKQVIKPEKGAEESMFLEKEGKTKEEKEAAEEALAHAHDANAGSSFKVKDIRMVKGWARVAVIETGVPVEEAMGFAIYLKKSKDDGWKVAEAGTDISPEDLPEAPPEILNP
ncbi:MAG: hypothetical protein PHO53_03160 [Actinomycetota bacterium]|nr:hypothetical protein [Actinomycetota bacterium]